jgi:hypothetical protein
MRKHTYINVVLNVLLLSFFLSPIFVFASTTNGTILSPDQYAWGENVGWVNLGTVEGDVHVTDTGLTGYMWDSIYGWVNLSPTGSGVVNDGSGNLSGYAWSAGTGFINFSGVVINSQGVFTGQAQGPVYGRINFDCSTCSVKTDWRSSVTSPSSGGGSYYVPTPPAPTPTPVPTPTPTPPVSPQPNNLTPNTQPPVNTSQNPVNTPSVNTPPTPAPGNTFQTTPSPVSYFINGGAVFANIKKAYDTAGKLINTKVGSVSTKLISTLGILAGITILLPAITFPDLWLILVRLFGLLLGLLGLKKKQRSWGTVYDSVTKRPLDPAYVTLIDFITNKEVASAITDLDGRYGFLVTPGTYRIVAQKTNYSFPSKKMLNISYDEVYNDLYHGDTITIQSEGEIITKNIPMDSLSFDWNEFAKSKMHVNTFMKTYDVLWAKISRNLFLIGGIVALIAVIFAPAPYNLIIGGFYILAFTLNYFVFNIKKSGTLTERETNTPLSFAIVKIFRDGEEVPLIKKIADKIGSYYVLVPNGRYFMTVEKKNDDATYTQVLNTETFNVENGLINMNLMI